MQKSNCGNVILGYLVVSQCASVTSYLKIIFGKNTYGIEGVSFMDVFFVIFTTKRTHQIWDTAGQERFRSMAPMYYRGSNAAILVYDITNYNTFTDIYSWVNELRKRVDPDLMLVVVGNKSDLSEQRAVTRATAEEYAQSIGASFFETSALTNEESSALLKFIAADVYSKSELFDSTLTM
ncbi:unnamed protein product, partial [Meganyctiphanes norvegica]